MRCEREIIPLLLHIAISDRQNEWVPKSLQLHMCVFVMINANNIINNIGIIMQQPEADKRACVRKYRIDTDARHCEISGTIELRIPHGIRGMRN